MARQQRSYRDLEVLYEDNHLLAINKPPGLLTQGDASGAICLISELETCE